MLIVPYIRLLLLGFLATLLPLVNAKGSSKSTSKISKTVVHGTNGSSHTECRNEATQEIVKCPKDKKAGIIAGAVVGSGMFCW